MLVCVIPTFDPEKSSHCCYCVTIYLPNLGIDKHNAAQSIIPWTDTKTESSIRKIIESKWDMSGFPNQDLFLSTCFFLSLLSLSLQSNPGLRFLIHTKVQMTNSKMSPCRGIWGQRDEIVIMDLSPWGHHNQRERRAKIWEEEQPSQQRIIQPEMAIQVGLRNPPLG